MSFNSETDLDTVLDKNSVQGYQRFKLVYILAQNIPRPYKYGVSDLSLHPLSNHTNLHHLSVLGLRRQSNESGALLP